MRTNQTVSPLVCGDSYPVVGDEEPDMTETCFNSEHVFYQDTVELEGIHVELEQRDRERLAADIEAIQREVALETEKDILECGEVVAEMLPPSVKSALERLRNPVNEIPFVFIDGYPIKRPTGFIKMDKNSELILAATSQALGRPFVAPNHRNGAVFLDLIPKAEDAGKQLGTGTELEWHTEDAQLTDTSKFICLLGLRGDPNAATLISTIHPSNMDRDLLQVLSQNRCRIRADASYHAPYSEDTPVVSLSPDGAYRFRYDPEFTDYPGNADRRAAEELKRLFDRHHATFTIDTGQMLIFNNIVSAHKRSNFAPSYSAKDRWIQRIMVA